MWMSRWWKWWLPWFVEGSAAYRERSPFNCNGSCPNARNICPGLWWHNTMGWFTWLVHHVLGHIQQQSVATWKSFILLQHFLFVYYYFNYILYYYCCEGVDGTWRAHDIAQSCEDSCTFMMHGKIREFDSIVTPNIVWLAQLTSFSVVWQIFHSPTAQASAGLMQ